MTYHSASSRRTKTYVVEPLRMTAADGGMYVTAWVPEYDEMRTFALGRVRTLGVLDELFELRTLPPEPFANSIGAFGAARAGRNRIRRRHRRLHCVARVAQVAGDLCS